MRISRLAGRGSETWLQPSRQPGYLGDGHLKAAGGLCTAGRVLVVVRGQWLMTEVVIKRLARTDWGLVLVVLCLLLFGLVMVYSASFSFGLWEWHVAYEQPAYFFTRQLVFALAGLAAMLVFWRIDYHLYRRYAVPIVVMTMLILVTMAVVGRWLFRNKSVQPVEVAKVGAMVYIAVWLESKGKEIRNTTLGLIPFAVLLGVMSGLILLQPDFSSAVLLVVTAIAMLFVAGADIRQLLIACVFGGAGLVFIALLSPYMRERIVAWFNKPFSDPQGKGFQAIQSLVALCRGRWTGVGLAQSQQKYFLSVVAHTDYLFAIIGEEWGFLGSVVVIALYALWAWRGLRIARYATDVYGRLLAVGIVSWITFQAMLNIAVVANMSPTTGTVLPLMSYGGSSLMSALASVGILLNISRGTREYRREQAR